MDKKFREMLAGYVDGELPEDQREALEKELTVNPELRTELSEMRGLKEVTNMMHYADLPDEVWEGYWHSLYRKLERGVGWIFLSVGAIVLLGFGAFEVFRQLFTNPENPLWLKIGFGGACLGGIILLVSFIRERLFAYNRERYREVEK